MENVINQARLRPRLHEPGLAPYPGQLDSLLEDFWAFTRNRGDFCRSFLNPARVSLLVVLTQVGYYGHVGDLRDWLEKGWPSAVGWLLRSVYTTPGWANKEKFYREPTRLNGSTLPSRRVTRLGRLTRAGYPGSCKLLNRFDWRRADPLRRVGANPDSCKLALNTTISRRHLTWF